MSAQRQQFRLVVEEFVEEGESRVLRTETMIESEEAARVLASWWLARPARFAAIAKGWIETRTVTDWQEIHQADRERRGG